LKNVETTLTRIESDVLPRLTPKQERFCTELLVDFNATQAAIRAGYSKKTARAIGSENLTKPDIQNRLSELSKKYFESIDASSIDTLKEAARIAFSDIGQAFDENDCLKPVSQMPEDVRRVISSIEVDEIWDYTGEEENRVKTKIGETKKVKFWNKDRQIEHLMKHLGLFAEDNKKQVTITNLADIAAIMGKKDKG
jgi:phage terminase small subunit